MPEEQIHKRHSSYAQAMESPIYLSILEDPFLPEICIPPPLISPLPLQCLAADALPETVKREIEYVIAECCGTDVGVSHIKVNA